MAIIIKQNKHPARPRQGTDGGPIHDPSIPASIARVVSSKHKLPPRGRRPPVGCGWFTATATRAPPCASASASPSLTGRPPGFVAHPWSSLPLPAFVHTCTALHRFGSCVYPWLLVTLTTTGGLFPSGFWSAAVFGWEPVWPDQRSTYAR